MGAPDHPELSPNPARRSAAAAESYRFVDLARKVVGVGSVGTHAWVALFVGATEDDTLKIQVKEAEASVLERFTGRSAYNNQGQRVVEGQRLMQAASDIFLGWQRVSEGVDGRPHDYYVRQLWDSKMSVNIDVILPDGLGVYAQLCGWTLARAHARSGDRIAIGSYIGASDVFRPGSGPLCHHLPRSKREGPRGAREGHRRWHGRRRYQHALGVKPSAQGRLHAASPCHRGLSRARRSER